MVNTLKDLWNSWKIYRFRNQKECIIDVYGIRLIAPSSHPIAGLIENQPYRDICIGITAKYTSQKYPDKSMVDIGANIGDTAVMIAKHCHNHLILIEGSDFYARYLKKNALMLANSFEIHEAVLNDGSEINATLHHWGGTALLQHSQDGHKIKTKTLSELITSQVCFVKSDADGYDFSILNASIDCVSNNIPVLLYEYLIRNNDDLVNSIELTNKLILIGYKFFILWDHAGNFILSSSDPDQLKEISLFMIKTINHKRSLGDLDIAFFHEKDYDVFLNVKKWFINN